MPDSVAFPSQGYHMSVVQQPVQDGGGRCRLDEETQPVMKVKVAGNDQ